MTTSAITATSTATSGASIAQAQQSLAGDQTTFLKLLTTQLKNQDPLSPLDANAFTAQLVQMTGVQQQIMTNQLLNQMVSSQGAVGSSVGLIGKEVTASTSAATLNGGKADWSYSLDSAAADVTLQVVDSSGNTVWQTDAGGLGEGKHSFSWNGKDLQGLQRSDGGNYGLNVIARTSSGGSVTSAVSLTGIATSIQQIDGTTVVEINGTKTPLSLVTGVSG